MRDTRAYLLIFVGFGWVDDISHSKVNGIGEEEKRGDLEHIYWVGTSRLVAPSQRVIKKVLQENEKYIYAYKQQKQQFLHY